MSDSKESPAPQAAGKAVTLDDLRHRIDAIDNELLNLISERAGCAQQVAEVKLRPVTWARTARCSSTARSAKPRYCAASWPTTPAR